MPAAERSLPDRRVAVGLDGSAGSAIRQPAWGDGPVTSPGPPPPPPPPPPENPPPLNPHDPDPDGVEAIVPPVVMANPSIDCPNSVNTNGRGETYQEVSGCTPSASNARAHRSVHPNTTAYGRKRGEDHLLLGPLRHVGLRRLDHAAEPSDPAQDRGAVRGARRHALGADEQHQAADDQRECRAARSGSTSPGRTSARRRQDQAGTPRSCQVDRTLSGRTRNQPRFTTSTYIDSSTTSEARSRTCSFSSEIVTSVPSRNSAFNRRRSYVSSPVLGFLETDQRPVGLAEPPLLRDLLDHQVTAHREVDDRRRHVEGVGLLVDQGAHLPGPHVVRGREFHRRLAVGVEGGTASSVPSGLPIT